jgi:putative transposase
MLQSRARHHPVPNCKNNPGNANLPIGGQRNAIQEDGAPISICRNGVAAVPRSAWHSRGYLPHFESSQATQHVTFHLADSLPQGLLLRLAAELKNLPLEKRDAERRKRVDEWIDARHGSCVLGKPRIAKIVQESLLAFDSQRYRMLAWVVMPNHVHVLFQPMNGWTVAKIVASWKKFTARKIRDDQSDFARNANLPIGASGSGNSVWYREYWDRYIRDQRHFAQAVEYIHQNPVKACLAVSAESWPWSSAYPGNANLRLAPS